MYLNVNLPAPQSEGSCTTPKTPEIVKTIINFTSSPLSSTQYQNQVTGDLLSPVSNVSTPSEEVASTPLGHHIGRSSRRHCSGSSSDGGGSGLMGGSPTIAVGGGPLVGATPPATPDLPSPVNTVQATRTALIKEGLKHQIKSKLQAAGVDADQHLLESKVVKDELTNEDSERRKRRRERNKIAATKCRNKKREKTIVLMSSLFQVSEEVEDQNVKLKTEIQRLRNEKLNLEKLLGDPSHQSCCRHNKPYSAAQSPPDLKESKMPLVLVTPPEASDSISTSAAVSLHEACVMTNACSSSMYYSSSPQSSFSNIPQSSPTTNVSQSITPLSSCNTFIPTSSIEPMQTSTQSTTLNSLPHSSQHLTQPTIHINQDVKHSPCLGRDLSHISPQNVAPNTEFSPVKRSNNPHSMATRHHPYEYTNNNQNMEVVNYGASGTTHLGSLSQEKQYCSQVNNSDINKYQYGYSKVEPIFSNDDFITPSIPPVKNNYLASKSRAANVARYHPYICAGRLQNNLPIDSLNPQRMRNIDNLESYDTSLGCGQQRVDHSFVSDQQQGSFYYL